LTPPADSEAMAAAIPGARLVTIPGAGHLTPMERPKAVSQALLEFFGAALA
jgi:pimeloyl-ACP methyl ester carboxylesterase